MSKTGKKTQADMPPTSMNKYERDRLLKIEANKKKMESLNIKRIAASMTSLVDSTNLKKKKGKNRIIADEDEEDYIPGVGEDVHHLDTECQMEADIVTKTKKKAQTKDGQKRSQFIPPLSLANFLKMNNKQRREVMGDDALHSVSSALKVVQQAIDSQQHIGLNHDINEDVDSDDISNEEFSQFMAMEREEDEAQYNTDDEYIPMDKETGQTPQEEQGGGGSDEDDMDEDAIWQNEVQAQLRGPNEIIHMDDELITSGKVKKTRGPVYCRKLTALAPGEKIFVEFDDDGNPVGKYATTFAYFLGDQIRNRTVCPVQVQGWEEFKTETLDHLWRCILEKCDFDNPELRREAVMQHARSLFRGSRYKLKKKYIVEPELTTKDEQLKNKPKDMLKADWKYLVELWRSPKFQEKSSKAKESRSFQKMPHYTGSKSHARVREDIKQSKGTCSRVDVLLETRKRKSSNPVNAANLDYNTTKIEEVNKQKKAREEGLHNKTDDEILTEVLGPDKHGYLRCYGRGKNITQHFGVKPSRINLVKEVVEVRRTAENVMDQAKNEIEKARQEVQVIRKEAEAAKKEAEAKVDEKIAANNEMWQKKIENLLKSYGIGPSH